MDTSGRSLVVIRHAKSDWSIGLADFDRPLSARGLRDAPAAGRWLAGLGIRIDASVVSPAARTRQTWDLVAQAAGLELAPQFVRSIYLGEAADMVLALRELPEDAGGAVLVGHSPGCPDLVEWLTQGKGEESAMRTMREKYPTAGAALLAVDGDWTDLGPGSARLLAFEVCRG